MKQTSLQHASDSTVKIRNFFLSIYVFLSFFEYYTVMSWGSITKYYIFLLMFITIATSRGLRLRPYHYILILWLGYKFASLLWTSGYKIFETHALSQVGFIGLLICLTALEDNEPTLIVLRQSSWVCSFILGVLSLFFSYAYQGEANRQVLTIFKRQLDPNNIAAFLLIGISISMYYFMYEKENRILHIATIIINAYATLMTGSRAALLAIGVIVLGYILTMYNPKTYRKSYMRIVPIVLIIIVAAIITFNFLPQDIADRLFIFEDYAGGNQRDVMWEYGLRIISDPLRLMVGAGWGAYQANGGYSSLHNTFLSILCDVGIIGFCLLFIPIIYMIVKLLKNHDVLSFSMFIAGMVPSFFIEAINKRFFWNAILFVLVSYNCYLNRDNNSNENKKEIPPTQKCQYIK